MKMKSGDFKERKKERESPPSYSTCSLFHSHKSFLADYMAILTKRFRGEKICD